jgi:hypothetical protein
VNIEEHYIKTYSSIDARRSDLLRLVEENPDRVDFLHELQVHVEVLFDMTERMRQEIEKPEFELVGAPVGESIEEVGWGSLDPGAVGFTEPGRYKSYHWLVLRREFFSRRFFRDFCDTIKIFSSLLFAII